VRIPTSVPIILEDLPGGKQHYGRARIEKTTITGRTRYIGTETRYRILGIIINPNSEIMKRGNYYDIYLNLVHEKHHTDTPEDGGTDNSEYEAYKEVCFHHYFKYASNSYQEHIEREFARYELRISR
jgi:hypothetical protein